MNVGYLLMGIAAVLLGVGRVIISDRPSITGRQAGHVVPPGQAGRPGALLPVRFVGQMLTGAGLALVGAGAVAGAWANTGPGPMNAADIVSLVLAGPGIVLIIGHSYLSRRSWAQRLVAKFFRQKATEHQPAAAPDSHAGPQRKPARLRYMAASSPRQRIRSLLAGVIMSVVSLLVSRSASAIRPKGRWWSS